MMGGVDNNQTDTTNRHERLQEGRRGPAKPSVSVWDGHNKNMWCAPAGPQAARRHLYKAAPCPLLVTVSHGGSMWDSSSVCVAAIVLTLSRSSVPLPNQHQALTLHYIYPILSPLYPKTLPPVPLWCFGLASPWPACMHLPPRPGGG